MDDIMFTLGSHIGTVIAIIGFVFVAINGLKD